MPNSHERGPIVVEVSSAQIAPEPNPTIALPSPWLLLRVWLGLGIQSFGGGAATLYLIRQVFVARRGWITEAEFTRYWSICQVAPGVNLVGLTILIGWRLAGAAGVAVSLAGLLLPSTVITMLLTALYASIQGLAVVQAALRGVIPATAGLGLLLALQMGRPLLAESRREGRVQLFVAGALLVGSALAVALWHLPVVGVLWAAGGIGALAQMRRGREQARQ